MLRSLTHGLKIHKRCDFAWALTSEQLLYVPAGVRGGELVDDVQRCLVVGVSDVHIHPGLRGQDNNIYCLYVVTPTI